MALTTHDGRLTNFLATWPRQTDIALTAPDAVYIRLALSPILHVNRLFLRADIGFDLGVDDNDSADEIFRLNIGGGIDLGSLARDLQVGLPDWRLKYEFFDQLRDLYLIQAGAPSPEQGALP
jgi:hypothetical protein